MPWLVSTLFVYGVGIAFAKTTGSFKVGPSMKVGSVAEKTAWEHERTRRAIRWPLSLLPNLYGG
jgi:hypothetical protein